MSIYEFKPDIPIGLSQLPECFTNSQKLEATLRQLASDPTLVNDIDTFANTLFGMPDLQSPFPGEIIQRRANLPEGEVHDLIEISQDEAGNWSAVFLNFANIRADCLLLYQTQDNNYATPMFYLSPESATLHMLLFVDQSDQGRLLTFPKSGNSFVATVKTKVDSHTMKMFRLNDSEYMVYRLAEVGDAYVFFQEGTEDESLTELGLMVLWLPQDEVL